MGRDNKNNTGDNEELGVITLNFDDDNEITCEIIAVYEAAGRDYIALLPIEGNLDNVNDGEVWLYRYSEDENEQPILEYIDTDEEQEIAADGFDQWLDSNEYDELVDEED